MSDLSKAYCKSCNKKHGYEQVTAMKYTATQDWGFMNWLFHLVMLFVTGFFWVGFLVFWLIGTYPRYRCQECNDILDEKDLRL